MEKEICKFCGLEFGNKVLKEHYSVVHQGEEQINKSIQEFLPEKNMNFEIMMKTPNEKKKTLKGLESGLSTTEKATL